jgi:hypothetical protein
MRAARIQDAPWCRQLKYLSQHLRSTTQHLPYEIPAQLPVSLASPSAMKLRKRTHIRNNCYSQTSPLHPSPFPLLFFLPLPFPLPILPNIIPIHQPLIPPHPLIPLIALPTRPREPCTLPLHLPRLGIHPAQQRALGGIRLQL